MVIKIMRNGSALYIHTAWASDISGTDISSEEFDDAVVKGTCINTVEEDLLEPGAYTWEYLFDADEAEDEVDSADVAALSDDIAASQESTDLAVGNVNLLTFTNKGTIGYSVSEGYTIEAVSESVLEDSVIIECVKVICNTPSDAGMLFFDASALIDAAEDGVDENTYTLSMAVKMTEPFVIDAPVIQDIEGGTIQMLFDAVDISASDPENAPMENEYGLYESSATFTAADATSQMLCFPLNAMPAGSMLTIANLKIEEGAFATPWRESLEEISQKADEAKKVATNYIEKTADGLIVGELTYGDLGNNVLIHAEGVDIRDGDQVLARYQSDAVYLGMNSRTATIDLCNGTAKMYNTADTAEDYNRLVLESEHSIQLLSNNLFVDSSFNADGVGSSTARLHVESGRAWDENNTTGKIHAIATRRLYESNAYTSSELLVDADYLELISEGAGIVSLKIDGVNEKIQLTGDAYFSKRIYHASSAVFDNGVGLRGILTTGDEAVLMYLSSNDNLIFGSGLYNQAAGDMYLYSNASVKVVTNSGGLTVNGTNVSLSGHTHAALWTGGTQVTALGVESDIYYFRPVVGVTAVLGSSSNPWNACNANILRTYDESTTSNGVNARIYNSRIYRYSSSSRRYKTNIEPISASGIDPSKLYDAEVVQFKYKEGYLIEEDKRCDQLIPGFIVEDLEKVYPIAIDYNDDGTPEMWNANIMIPAMLHLIQEQNKRIEALERKVS